MSTTTERRAKNTLRRDLNDLVRSPDGKVSEAKTFVVAFKLAMLYVFLTHTSKILSDWMLLAVFVGTFIFPDLLKKLFAAKFPSLPLRGTPIATEEKR